MLRNGSRKKSIGLSWTVNLGLPVTKLLLGAWPEPQRETGEIAAAVARFFRQCLLDLPLQVPAVAKERYLKVAVNLKERIEKGLANKWWLCAPNLQPFVEEKDTRVFATRMPEIEHAIGQVKRRGGEASFSSGRGGFTNNDSGRGGRTAVEGSSRQYAHARQKETRTPANNTEREEGGSSKTESIRRHE